MSSEIQIAGAGPAGTAAAIAAMSEGAAVHICERSRNARHKVCGEFISPEAFRELAILGVSSGFMRLNPPLIRRCVLHLGARDKTWNLSEPGFGLSRFALDRLMLDHAAALGAQVSRGTVFQPRDCVSGEAVILATGRRGAGARGKRIFGFKAHFEGPVDDAVELCFTRFGYIGISAIEDGLTNVCGLAPEESLHRCNFDIDELLAGEPALSARLRPLTRRMPWLQTGPLSFSRVPKPAGIFPSIYPAGDGLGFVDPFTGSGILNALLTGRMAGTFAARRQSAPEYVRACARLLDRPFAASAAFRGILRTGARQLAMLVPGNWLYRVTRAQPLDAFNA